MAGLALVSGGSAKLLGLVKQGKIIGLISEIIFDEVQRHAQKIGFTPSQTEQKIKKVFKRLSPPPKKATVSKFYHLVIDCGDSHLLASCQELKAKYLVTLDKKHLLSLKDKIKFVKIVSPGEFLEQNP